MERFIEWNLALRSLSLKRRALYQDKIENLMSEEVVERNFKLSQPIQDVSLIERKLEYLYLEGKDYLFLDTGNLEQVLVPSQMIGDKIKLLLKGGNRIQGNVLRRLDFFRSSFPNF